MDMGEFTARDIVGPVRLVSQSRDITIAQFTQSLDLETQRGDIELQPGGCLYPPSRRIPAPAGSTWCCRRRPLFNCRPPPSAVKRSNDFGPQIQKQVEAARPR